MAYPRILIDTSMPQDCAVGQELSIPLSSETARHLKVIRMQPDEILVVVDNQQRCYSCFFESCEQNILHARLNQQVEPPRLPDVTLVQGLSKGERMDQTIRQATELGVKRIIPLLSSRVIVKLNDEKASKRQDRWKRVALSAVEQSDCAVMPVIEEPANFAQCFELLKDYDAVLFAWEECKDQSIHQALANKLDALGDRPSDPKVAIIVGPEGGFSSQEAEAMVSRGYEMVSLGDTILRTETAGVVALALVSYELGGMGSRPALSGCLG